MILTEEEAKTKWCPMARILVGDMSITAINRDGEDRVLSNARCIASECMLWERVLARDDKRPGIGRCGLGRP